MLVVTCLTLVSFPASAAANLSTISSSLQLWEGWMLVFKVALVTMQLSPSAELFLFLGFHLEFLLWNAMV